MATYPDVHIVDLRAAYEGWPGAPADKTALAALILRVRIERAAALLPRTVIAAASDISHVERRLRLSIGEPGLSRDGQILRMRIVADANATYAAICNLLHGRTSNPSPTLTELNSWNSAVDSLEKDLFPNVPAQNTPKPRFPTQAPYRTSPPGRDADHQPRPSSRGTLSPVQRPPGQRSSPVVLDPDPGVVYPD